ncbi:MAG: hypothetical protein AAFY17_08650 [Cyanobacteria bacterium J06642_11]
MKTLIHAICLLLTVITYRHIIIPDSAFANSAGNPQIYMTMTHTDLN